MRGGGQGEGQGRRFNAEVNGCLPSSTILLNERLYSGSLHTKDVFPLKYLFISSCQNKDFF